MSSLPSTILRCAFDNFSKEFDYKIYTKEFDEIVNANILCDLQELERLRLSLGPVVVNIAFLVSP